MKTNEIVRTSHTPACYNGRCLRFVRDLPMTVVFVLFFTHTRLRLILLPSVSFSLPHCSLSLLPSYVCLSVCLSLSQLRRVRQRDCRPIESFNLIRYLTDNNRALFKRNTLKKLAPLLYTPTPTYVWGVENF